MNEGLVSALAICAGLLLAGSIAGLFDRRNFAPKWLLVAAVLFHALNGIRVILVDFWSNGPRFQKQMTYGVLAVWAVLFVPFVIRHLSNVFGG